MMELWIVTVAANLGIVGLYAAISITIARGLAEGLWRSNPIALATAGIFATCAVGHGFHAMHVVPPWSVMDPVTAAAGLAMFSDWRLAAWDALTAGVAVWYWVLRSRFAIVYRGASLCEDMASRQRQAEQLRVELVAGLAQAEADFSAGRREDGLRRLDRTLEQGKSIITTLIGEGRRLPHPGELKRRGASR